MTQQNPGWARLISAKTLAKYENIDWLIAQEQELWDDVNKENPDEEPATVRRLHSLLEPSLVAMVYYGDEPTEIRYMAVKHNDRYEMVAEHLLDDILEPKA